MVLHFSRAKIAQVTSNYLRCWMGWASKPLISFQCPLVHLLRLCQLALISIEITQVVDNVECRYMLGAPCFLLSFQCPQTHLLRLYHLALISIEKA